MLGDLAQRLQTRLQALREQVPTLVVETYGDELKEADPLPGLIARSPALLLATPRAIFRKRGQDRHGMTVTLHLFIVTRRLLADGETDTDVTGYGLWQACMAQLVDWQPWPDQARIEPIRLTNRVNRRPPDDAVSVLCQRFAIELDWRKPTEDLPDLLGIDLHYHSPADAADAVATDIIDLRSV